MESVNKVKYRMARISDTDSIAFLHALSWQIHYRGLLSDAYLDNEVVEERLLVWHERCAQSDPKRHLLVATNAEDKIIGFVCTFLDYHEKWGAYLDNLHVSPDYQGYGIGVRLMKEAGLWVQSHRPHSTLYLHVIKANSKAIAFYEKIGGKLIDEYDITLPDNTEGTVLDYLWDTRDLAVLT